VVAYENDGGVETHLEICLGPFALMPLLPLTFSNPFLSNRSLRLRSGKQKGETSNKTIVFQLFRMFCKASRTIDKTGFKIRLIKTSEYASLTFRGAGISIF